MKMLRWMSALCMLSVSTMASAQRLPTDFRVGYNEAWFVNYGNWLASNPLFGESSAFSVSSGSLVSNMFSGMEAGNAKIVRIWLFPDLQGICINKNCSCPQPATQCLTNEFLGNLKAVFSLVRTYNKSLSKTATPLKLYITALNAGDANLAQCLALAPQSVCKAIQTYYQNLFSNNGGATQTYETNVLGQILGVMSQNQDVIYGFDLINEIEAAINAGYFSDFWIGARTWIQNMTKFVKSYPCAGDANPSCTTIGQWLPVTSTAGLGFPVLEVTFGLFSGLGLNFYDVHIYSDTGTYSGQTALCFKTRLDNLQIVLGEYGQKSQTGQDLAGDSIQYTATTNFLNRARNSCFSSALAWKYEALDTTAPWLSYLYVNDGVLLTPLCPTLPPPLQSQQVPGLPPPPGLACTRPAYTIIQNFVP
jgi:hypothetical protein